MYKIIDDFKANCKYYTQLIVLVIEHWENKYNEA
jgi:hypothetical protein